MSSGNDSKPDHYQINAKICRLVEHYPCMYDRSHPHYLKKDVVDKAWVKISKEMDDSISSCKERWRNIRTSFARSINVNKIPASANRTKPYYLHEELQFLARHITPGIPVSRRSNAYYSAGEESEVIEVSVGEESFDGFAAMIHDEDDSQGQQSSNDESVNDIIKSEIKPHQHLQQFMEEETDIELAQISSLCPPKKRFRFNDNFIPQMDLDRERDIKPTEFLHDPDFDASFLQGLLPEMKAMDFRQKILFKRRIYEVIGEIFESELHANTNGCSSSSPMMSRTYTPTMPANNMSYAPKPALAVINANDLAMIRRLNNLIHCTSAAAAVPSTVAAGPNNVASISSTVDATLPATATVAVHRGALTRSTANLLRVTMVNPPVTSATQYSPLIKQEPVTPDE